MIISSFLEFHPERISSPQVIVGLIVMLIGFMMMVFAKSITQKIFKENNKPEKVINIKFISFAISIIGCLIAVINI